MELEKKKIVKRLLEKYSSGIITSEELAELKDIINESTDVDLKSTFDALWEEAAEGTSIQNSLKEKIFAKIQVQISTPLRSNSIQKSKNKILKIVAVAAIVLFLVLSWNLWNVSTQNKELLAHGSNEVVVRVGRGERVSIVLPDGTNVRLNSQSELVYQQSFGLSDRNIKLKGEGYFDVTKNKEVPFIITTDKLDIKVLGTQFNVFAHEDFNYSEITLVEGKVAIGVTEQPEKRLDLNKNEKVVYNKETGEIKLEKTSGFLETAWISHELAFRSSPLGDVFEAISRKYGFNIHLENVRGLDELYTGVFDEPDIEEVLRVLKGHFGFQYRIKEYDIYIN